MSSDKCRSCGSTSIDTDPGRGDAICTQCGVVFEDQIIVSEMAFEEGRGGNAVALGQFVSSDSTGGAASYGGGNYMLSGRDSSENTIRKAKVRITHLGNQLQLNPTHISQAVNFYKMALTRRLTRGRRVELNYAACVYLTCRTERTSHLLIDISDVLQICVQELGRTYLKFVNAFQLQIPSMDAFQAL